MTSKHLQAPPTRLGPPVAVHIPDLDAQIEALEQRLVAREAWLRSAAESLTQRAQAAITPSSWVLPAVGAGTVFWLGWRWWRRRDPAPKVNVDVQANVSDRPFAPLANLPWAGLTALVWPLAPAAWRARVSSAAAVTVVSTAVSIAQRLTHRGGR